MPEVHMEIKPKREARRQPGPGHAWPVDDA
jgi:hypothetical protein